MGLFGRTKVAYAHTPVNEFLESTRELSEQYKKLQYNEKQAERRAEVAEAAAQPSEDESFKEVHSWLLALKQQYTEVHEQHVQELRTFYEVMRPAIAVTIRTGYGPSLGLEATVNSQPVTGGETAWLVEFACNLYLMPEGATVSKGIELPYEQAESVLPYAFICGQSAEKQVYFKGSRGETDRLSTPQLTTITEHLRRLGEQSPLTVTFSIDGWPWYSAVSQLRGAERVLNRYRRARE